MDSNSRYQLQQHQPNSGLLRFRSAPGSVLSNLTQGGGGSAAGSSSAANKANPWEGLTSSEPERLVLRFLNSSDSNGTASPGLREFEDKDSADKATNDSSSPLSRMNSQQGFSAGLPPSFFLRQNSTASSAMNSSYGVVGSMGMDHQTHPKAFGSDLLRQSSFPAGHFSNNISFQNGYDTMKGVGNYGGVNSSDSGRELSLSMNRLQNQISFSRGPSSLGMLSQISKMGSESSGATSTDEGRQGGSNGDARYYAPRFPYGSGNETSHLSEKFNGSKRERNSDDKLFYNAQHGELGNQVHTLSHHLSFPKTTSEMFATETSLQFPDSVPCKIRAKRGCATHPRSIAERVRRTRISERMRKLQELVPNMDKQTSTADMLDLAVVYIKDLQKQFKTLNEKRAKCRCISMQSDSNQTG